MSHGDKIERNTFSSIVPDGKIVPDNGQWDTVIYSPTEK